MMTSNLSYTISDLSEKLDMSVRTIYHYIERFNRTYREDVLNMNICENISHVRDLTDKFTENYNQNHPHHSLNGMTPIGY